MRLRSILTNMGTSSPYAFAIVAIYAASWLIFNPESREWHSVATLATSMMTLFVQRAEHRDIGDPCKTR